MISIDQVSRFFPFNSLSEEYLDQVVKHAEVELHPEGKLLFKRGKTLPWSYYLMDGLVDLVNKDWQSEVVDDASERAQWPLNQSSPSTVSAMSKSKVRLLKVDAEFLDVAMAWSQSAGTDGLAVNPTGGQDDLDVSYASLAYQTIEVEEDSANWVSALLNSPLFTRLPVVHLQQVIAKFESMPVKAGELIIKEGMPGDYFYVIDKGRVRVQSQASGLDLVLGPGQIFGEEALVADTLRNASIHMQDDGVLMRLAKEEFLQLLQEPLMEHLQIQSLQQLDQHENVQLLDIRLPIEHRHQRVPESHNLPLSALRKKAHQLDKHKTYVVTDDGGRRSLLAVHLLCSIGVNACLLDKSEQFYIGL